MKMLRTCLKQSWTRVGIRVSQENWDQEMIAFKKCSQ